MLWMLYPKKIKYLSDKIYIVKLKMNYVTALDVAFLAFSFDLSANKSILQ